MPYLPVPLTSLDLSVDKLSEAASYGQIQQDGYFKRYMSPDGPKLIWCKRPGLTAWCDTTNSADIWDIYYGSKSDLIFAVCYSPTNGEVYKINVSTGAATEITGTAKMTGQARPSFVEASGSGYMQIATGQQIGRYPTTSGTGAYLTDADAPTTVGSICVLNNSLIAQRTASKQFDWSDAGSFTTWTGSFATTETTPGDNLRVFSRDNYLWFFKKDAIEVWRDDGLTFVRESQGSISVQLETSASVEYINGSFYFLDANLDIRKLTGLNLETISNPYLSGYIASIADFTKVQGGYFKHDGKDFYIMQFWGSSANVPCLVYDIELNQFYKWGFYNSGTYERWPISGFCTANNSIWYAGDYNNGKVHKVSGTTDLGSDIYSRLRTDFVDRGSPDTWKQCHELTLLMKRSSTATTAKNISIRYRDDGTQTWSTAVTAAIEAASTTELKVNFRRLGKYKRRQWEFLISDATVASLVSAWERFSVGVSP